MSKTKTVKRDRARRMDDNDKVQITQLKAEGMTHKEISNIVGFSAISVGKFLKKNGEVLPDTDTPTKVKNLTTATVRAMVTKALNSNIKAVQKLHGAKNGLEVIVTVNIGGTAYTVDELNNKAGEAQREADRLAKIAYLEQQIAALKA